MWIYIARLRHGTSNVPTAARYAAEQTKRFQVETQFSSVMQIKNKL